MKKEDFLTFRKMITPSIIQIVFWIGVALCVIGGIISIIGGATTKYGGGAAVLYGILLLFLGPLGIRICCEFIIVVFRINDTLTEIKGGIKGKTE